MNVKYPEINDVGWLRGQITKKPLRQIAEEVGCSYSAIVYQKSKHHIEIPKRITHRRNPRTSQAIKKALKQRFPDGRFGKLASNWKGGKRKHPTGYQILKSEHPFADCRGYVFEHRLIVEKEIGRYLTKKEVVHHINGDRYDNRPENLEALTRSQHVQKHFDAIKEVVGLKKENEELREILRKYAEQHINWYHGEVAWNRG